MTEGLQLYRVLTPTHEALVVDHSEAEAAARVSGETIEALRADPMALTPIQRYFLHQLGLAFYGPFTRLMLVCRNARG